MWAEFVARLRLLTQNEGGRSEWIRSGYRGLMRFGSDDAEPAFGVQIDFKAERFEPREEADVEVRTWADENPPQPTTRVFLFEGGKLVGTGFVRNRR
jgi:translation elongation factor EF-Tu-like GTPase